MSLERALAEVSERNAVRRAAGLPLLDVDATVKAILDRKQAREWGRAAERHKDDLARLKAVLIEDYRQRTGKDQPDSFGGRLSLQIRAGQLFDDFLSGHGYTRPRTRRIDHGSGWKMGVAGKARPSPDMGSALANGS